MLRVRPFPIAARTAFLVTLAGVLVLALSPVWLLQNFGFGLTSHDDKLNHAAAFVVLTAIGSLAWPEHRARLIVFLALTGAAIEILQGMQIISRDMDIFDWFADCVGIACGLAIASWTKKLVRGESPN
ncbi:hypothetical protein NKJ46_30250 [Mesorhizobium sp. M0166]|uniref:hypothetical protein n=1 Tax=unclassified Mesorhizobium TaxID=325217 RepID=UPI003339BCFC